MRTIKELLEVMRDDENQKYFIGGFCGMTIRMASYCVISEEEQALIDNYISSNGPMLMYMSQYRWRYGEWEPRLAWLNEQIEKLEKEQQYVPM